MLSKVPRIWGLFFLSEGEGDSIRLAGDKDAARNKLKSENIIKKYF
jgi:hypothetical protein